MMHLMRTHSKCVFAVHAGFSLDFVLECEVAQEGGRAKQEFQYQMLEMREKFGSWGFSPHATVAFRAFWKLMLSLPLECCG